MGIFKEGRELTKEEQEEFNEKLKTASEKVEFLFNLGYDLDEILEITK